MKTINVLDFIYSTTSLNLLFQVFFNNFFYILKKWKHVVQIYKLFIHRTQYLDVVLALYTMTRGFKSYFYERVEKQKTNTRKFVLFINSVKHSFFIIYRFLIIIISGQRKIALPNKNLQYKRAVRAY